MPKFSVTRSVPYSVDQVFAIASDVARYRQFLPLVRRSVVRNQRTLPDGRVAFDAELVVAYKKLGIGETLVSSVVVDRAANLVTSSATEGPVKHLHAEWQLVATGTSSCEIQFNVDYALKSRSLQFILSGMFDMIVRRIMVAFEERAKELYGASTVSRRNISSA